uniref:Uncharacterized protein n=1 Tax=Helianthus annuus TaxID=4232 RepID=A0A251UCJ5_HELAN
MFPPSVNLDNIDWSTRRLQIDFPVQFYWYCYRRRCFFPSSTLSDRVLWLNNIPQVGLTMKVSTIQLVP